MSVGLRVLGTFLTAGLLLAALSVVGTFAAAETAGGTVVVAAKRSLVRGSPSLEAKVVVPAAVGTEFEVVGSSAGWVKVALATGGEGWLPKGEVALKVNRDGKVCLEMGLEEALKLGSLQGGFAGTGGSSGDSVVLRAKGKLKLEICPEFRRGTTLANANAGAQSMVLASLRGIPEGAYLRPVAHLRFEPEVEAEYIFEAYCLDFHKDNPSGSDQLSMSGAAPEAVQKVLSVSTTDVMAKQLAIWAITDDVNAQDVEAKFGATQSDIHNARRVLEMAGVQPATYQLFKSKK
jgi:hypothetical protein